MTEETLLLLVMEEEEDEEEVEEDIQLLSLISDKNKKGAKIRWWVHPVTGKRGQHGTYYRLVKELELDADKFKDYFRLSQEQFQYVLEKVEASILRTNTRMRQAITPRERLAVTLR